MIAISVNEEERQAGMYQRWPGKDQLFVSDPGGETYLQPLGLFDPEERGGIALPGMLVIAPDGTEVYRYQGRDFADRTSDEDMFAALEGLGLPAIEAPAGGPTSAVPETLKGFFAPSMYGPYFRGNMFGAIAIAGRITDPESAEIAKQHRRMAKASIDAWDEVRARS